MWLRTFRLLGATSLLVALAASCGGATRGAISGSESHFLASCGQACSDGLSCICGVCTRVCDDTTPCSALSAGARCIEVDDVPGSPTCSGVSRAQSVCDRPCSGDPECASVGAGFACVSGVCRERGWEPGPEPEPDPEPNGACELPLDAGPCNAAFPRWGFDARTGACEQFTYGGCEGNANNFESRTRCEQACAVFPAEFFACERHSDCVPVNHDICPCEPMDFALFSAVNRAHRETYEGPPPEVACAPCPPATATSQNFGAWCQAGRCEMFDVRQSELSECETDDQCVLRQGLECCERPGELVSLRAELSLTTQFECPEPEPGQECGAMLLIPPSAKSACVAGHCEVVPLNDE